MILTFAIASSTEIKHTELLLSELAILNLVKEHGARARNYISVLMGYSVYSI